MAVQVKVNQDIPRSVDEGVWTDVKGTKRGELCIIDFFTQMVIEENAYQIRLGTTTNPVTSDATDITDADADAAVAALAETTVIPCELWISLDTQATDAIEMAAKSVGVSTMTGGTAFEPLNLCLGGKPAITKGMVGGAGAITVGAELDTTTRQHFHMSVEFTKDAETEIRSSPKFPELGGPSSQGNPIIWHPKLLPVCKGAACFYVQVAGATACTYFAHFDYIELPTTSVI